VQRWRVLLITRSGDAAEGHFDLVSQELPDAGEIIQVRNRRDRESRTIRARVQLVDPANPLPIAAVEEPFSRGAGPAGVGVE
jgi:hypothetical protein